MVAVVCCISVSCNHISCRVSKKEVITHQILVVLMGEAMKSFRIYLGAVTTALIGFFIVTTCQAALAHPRIAAKKSAFRPAASPAKILGIEENKVDLEPNFTKWLLSIKSQNPRGTCSVFTVVAGMEYALSRQANRGIRLSEEFCNWAANDALNNPNGDGQFFYACEAGYNKNGICELRYMPYAQKFDPERRPSAEALANALEIKQRGLIIHWIKPNGEPQGLTGVEFQQIKDALRKGWPVCSGSYHSLLFTGYVDDPSLPGGGQFLLHDSAAVQNGTMSYEEARRRICDALWFEAPLK